MPQLNSNKLVSALQKVYRQMKYGYWEPEFQNVSVLLQEKIAKIHNWNVVQIGANDGESNDLLYPLLKKNDFSKAILVEPLLTPYLKLEERHKNSKKIITLNVAISSKKGKQKMYTLNSKPGMYFNNGISSFYKEHLEKFIQYEAQIADLITETEVDVVLFADLLQYFDSPKINLLCIDTEGYDFEILKQVPFASISIDVIVYEWCHLSQADMIQSFELLRSLGYRLVQWDGDVMAYKV